MTTLSQIVAVEKGVKQDAGRRVTDAYHALQNPTPFAGETRTYQPREDDGDTLPPKVTEVQAKVADKLTEIATALVRLFDVEATKDIANTDTSADVVVDGTVFVTGAPVPLLLFLEKYLTDIRTILVKLPVLNPSVRWNEDAVSGLYRSEPVQTVRTAKVPKAHVLYPATDKHPAQVESFTVDAPVGDYTDTLYSGAVTVRRRDELIERVTKLLEAVKFAREEANRKIVEDVEIGEVIFEYLFA